MNRVQQVVTCLGLCVVTAVHGLETAGDVLVNFDASVLTPGTAVTSLEAVRSFTAEGSPTVEAYTTNGVTVNGLTFDGIDDYLVSPAISTNSVINQPFTVEAWVLNPSVASGSGAENIFAWSAETADNTQGACLTYNNAGEAGWLGKFNVPFCGGIAPHPGQWHAITITYSGGSSFSWEWGLIRVYVDGVLNRWIPATQRIDEIYRWADCGVYTIGARLSTNETPTAFFSGALARLRFHSGTLSPQQVRANYETERNAFPVYAANTVTALENSGDVILDLDASGLSDGALAAWSGNSTQTLTQATTSARPTVGTINGVKAVTFDGNDWLDVAGVDSRLIGSTTPFTVEAYIYNPTIENEESYFCWAPRGNSGAVWDGKCRSLSYGAHTGYGAVGFWKPNWEMGFSPIPAAATWHHIVTTYDGTTMAVYVDGVFNTSKVMAPNATVNVVYSIGRASSQDGNNIKWFSGSIARLRICTGALSAQQVYRNAAYLKHVLASGPDTVIANAYGNSAYSSITDISGNGDYTTASIQLTDGASLTIATNTVAGQIGVMNNAALTVNDNATLNLYDRLLVSGSDAASLATLTVSGAIKSLVSATRYALAVGVSGKGQATINQNASVNLATGSEVWVGSGSNGVGTLTVKGVITNSAWFLIGRYGGSGSATVDGGNISCSGNLQIGEATDNARLILTNGAKAFFAQANIGVWGGTAAIDVSRNSTLTINGILMNYLKLNTSDWGSASIRLANSTFALGAGGIRTKDVYIDLLRDLWIASPLPIEVVLADSTFLATANTRIYVPLGLHGSNTIATAGKTLTLRDAFYGDSFTANNSVLEITPKHALRQDVALTASTLTIENLPYRWRGDSLGIAHGSPVSSWGEDNYESGAARIHTGPLMVTNAINGHSALRFNTDLPRQMRINARQNPLAGAEAATIAVVFKPYAYGYASGPYSWWNSTLLIGGEYSGSANDWGFIFGQDGRIGLALSQVSADGAMDIVQYHTAVASLNAPHVALCSWQPGNVAMNLDGDETLNPTLYTSKGSSESNGSLPNTLEGVTLPRSTYPLYIGDGAGKQYACFNGEIAEIRIYRNQYMDRVARQKLVRDIATSYGLTTIAATASAATTNATYAADFAKQNSSANAALPTAAAIWSAETLQAADGTAVTRWDDSVSARPASGSATYIAAGIGGRPAVQVNANPWVVASDDNPLNGAQQFTAALVFQADTSFASPTINWWNGGGLLGNKISALTNNNDWGLALVNGRIVAGAGAQVTKSYNYPANYTVSMIAKSKPQLADGNPHVLIYRWSNSGAHIVSVDGIAFNLDSVGYARSTQPLLIGGTLNTNGFSGLVAEVRLYTNRLTDAQEGLLGSELAAKYNAYPTAYGTASMLPGQTLVLNGSTLNISTNYYDLARSTLVSNQTLIATGTTAIKGMLCVGNQSTLAVPSPTDTVTLGSFALQSGATLAWKFAGTQSTPIHVTDDLALPDQFTLDLSGSTGNLGHATTLIDYSGTLTQPVGGPVVNIIGATQPGTKVIVLASEKRVIVQPPQGTILIVH